MNHIRIYGLPKGDLIAERVAKIKEALRKAVQGVIIDALKTNFPEKHLSFEFQPLTIASEMVVVIEATLIRERDDDDENLVKNSVAEQICLEFWLVVKEWRSLPLQQLGDVKVRVVFASENAGCYIG